jgi:hypothetical protein
MLEHSSLSEKVKDALFRLMVGSFHGHAHNWACQLEWHPLYIKGTGHSDGEGCEHVFASSNDLAHGTRHASCFHRHQAIEEHFMFWDQDKYANLSKIIWFIPKEFTWQIFHCADRSLHSKSLSRSNSGCPVSRGWACNLAWPTQNHQQSINSVPCIREKVFSRTHRTISHNNPEIPICQRAAWSFPMQVQFHWY